MTVFLFLGELIFQANSRYYYLCSIIDVFTSYTLVMERNLAYDYT